MSKVESAVSWAVGIAENNAHGYGWGGWGPDYDCGHLIISAWEQAGVPVRTRGASYTGNMASVFMACGFQDVTALVNLASGAGMQRGDVLVNRSSHAAMFVGGGRLVQARKDLDGIPGDGSGQEIRVQSYYNFPWDCVLRYQESAQAAPTTPQDAADATGASQVAADTPAQETGPRILKRGMSGDDVKELQTLLCKSGALVDGDFDTATHYALLKYQGRAGLLVDGEAGELTMTALREETGELTGATAPAETAAEDKPSERTYTVRAGDTLWGIAVQRCGSAALVGTIKAMNGLTSDLIHVGQVLKLPVT